MTYKGYLWLIWSWNLSCVSGCTVSEEGRTGDLLLFAQLAPRSFLLLFQALVGSSQVVFEGLVRQRDVQTVPVHWLGHVHRLCHFWMDGQRQAGSLLETTAVTTYSQALKMLTFPIMCPSVDLTQCPPDCLVITLQQHHLLLWGHVRPWQLVLIHQPSE